MRKITLPNRLDPALIFRLKAIAKARKVSVNEAISRALDALEQEGKSGGSLTERVSYLEKNLSAMLDLINLFGDKMDEKFNEASEHEKERLKALFTLLDGKLVQHDEAEKGRLRLFWRALNLQVPPASEEG